MSSLQRAGFRSRNRLMQSLIPTPPEISRQRPESFLRRCDKAIEGASFTDDGRNLVSGLDEHANFSLLKYARILGLDHENTLKDSAVDQGYTEERVICLFARFLHELEARMILHIGNLHWTNLFGDQPGKSLMQCQAKRSDTAG